MNFKIRNWEKFQHYKHRNPPWIKLHYDIFASEDWVMIDDASKLLAIACMLIASRHNGEVPNNPEYVKRIAFLNKIPDFAPLVACGFLESNESMQADASTMQADADPEKRREEKRREEKNKAPNRAMPDRCSLSKHEIYLSNLIESLNWIHKAPTWTEAQVKILADSAFCPAINKEQTIRQANGWIVANPQKAKEQVGRFLINWFNRQQERGGQARAQQPTPPIHMKTEDPYKNTKPASDAKRREFLDKIKDMGKT